MAHKESEADPAAIRLVALLARFPSAEWNATQRMLDPSLPVDKDL